MTVRVSGKNIDVGEALRDRVNTRIEDVVGRYFEGKYSGHVTICKDGFGFKTDCIVHLDTGMVLEADAFAGDAYASADQAMSLMDKRLRRYKSRLKDRGRRADGHAAMAEAANLAPSYVLEAPDSEDEEEVTAFNPVTIAESTTALKRISVSDAVMELDMTGVPVMIFQHDGSGRVNIIYRRSDGNIGWIDPPVVTP